MLWSGIGTAVLSASILSVGQPLWELTIIQPITVAKLKQDLEVQMAKEEVVDDRLLQHEKLLTRLNDQVEELIRIMRKFH